MKEIWVPIKGYKRIYSISNKSRVRSCDRKVMGGHGPRPIKGIILRQNLNNSGYFKVNLGSKQKFKTKRIHRLVALHFIPLVKGKKFVNHKNGIKTDNRISNLEWCTKLENNLHAIAMGLNRGNIKILDRIIGKC